MRASLGKRGTLLLLREDANNHLRLETMKVGVLFSNTAPTAGGAFTFQDEVFQSLISLESKHSFVIFGYLTESQAREAGAKQLQFFPFPRSFPGRAVFYLARRAASIVAGLPIIGNRIRVTNRFQRAIQDIGIEFMWFINPTIYFEVDIPYIFTVWDLQHRLQPWFPEVTAKRQWRLREQHYASAIPRASAVIIGTESGKAEIVQFYGVPPERVKLVPHPTPRFALCAPKNSGKEVLAKYRIPEGYLFYPAQFWPHKNHVGLLLAVNLLREKYNLILPVVFVGSDTGNLPHVRRMVDELGLSGQIHFLGFVPQEDLLGLYRNAFALIYLTFFGPENLPPLEAFALGCPVIASNVAGAQEQLGDAALLVDPRDEEQIVLVVKSLYDDLELRRTLIQRGFERAIKWTGEDYVRSVFAILDEFEPIRRCWGKG
jgi:glycosyltransferase involved in cell wall biosynthesis